MILIGVPVNKDFTIDVRTAAYCSAEAMRPGVKWGYVASREAGVGRSTFVHFALKNPEVTHLYFIDSDVVPPDGALQKLLDHNLPIVAGIYPMNVNGERAWSFKMKGGPEDSSENNVYGGWLRRGHSLPKDLIKATAIGGSTLLIKREVVEKLKKPCFKIVYKPIDDEGRCYDYGEDEYFSKIATEAGYDIMVDPTIICKHYNYKEL